MERTRNVPIALKTTPEMKEKLNKLTDRMSDDAGYLMTQTQVIEKLIADATKVAPDSEEVVERKGYVANHALVMNNQSGHSPRLQLQTQLNANRFADLFECDIRIMDMTSGMIDAKGNYVKYAESVRPMLEVLHFILGSHEYYQFNDPVMALYHQELADLLGSYTDMGVACSHPFSVLDANGCVIGMGYTPYLNRKFVEKGLTDKDMQLFQSVLDTMLGLAITYGISGCRPDDFSICVLMPKNSIYMPDIGDGETSTLTVCLMPRKYALKFMPESSFSCVW